MGKLTELEQWDEDIYQIETSDPVLGGPEGLSNRPQKQLANRTLWLKKRLEDANNALAEHEKSRNHPDATLTAKGFVRLYSGVTSLDETMAATPKAVKIAMDNGNARMAKDRNGSDIPNKALFRQNLELGNSATRNVGTTANTVAAGDDSRITGAMQKDQNGADIPDKPGFIKNVGLTETVNRATNAVQKTGDTMTGSLTLRSDKRVHFIIQNVDGSVRTYIYKDKDGGGVCINNGVDGGGDFILHKDGSFYAPSGVRAGVGKKLSLTSTNNSTLAATFNLWGDASRPTVIELDDDQGWHLYSQRNPDGTIRFTVNGDITAGRSLYAGNATLYADGDVKGSIWGGWLHDFLNNNYNRKNTAGLGGFGWVRDESTGFIMQWGTLSGSNGTYNFPRAFPAACFAVFVTNTSSQGDRVDNAFGYPVNNSQFFAATKASTNGSVVNGYPVAWFAIGR
ncbi:hypothetical protein ELD99_12360 [Salmonella enterica subsp. enterica]|nr:hypothetical protein [Salmonella enterica subsp. enterica]